MRELPGGQQSDRWLKNRLGRITASRICDVMAYLKRGGESEARKKYRRELVAERITNRAEDNYVSPEMERGSALEEEARERYELATGKMVCPVGFVLHPKFDFAGASPDGLIDDDGCLEIKCPKTVTMLDWLDTKQIPEEYVYQIQWQLACTGRQWTHFMAYDDRLPEETRYLVIQAERDEAMIQAIENEVVKIHEEAEAMIQKLGLPPTRWVIPIEEGDEPGYDHSADFLTNAARAIGEQEIPV